MLTQERLKEFFNYNLEDGLFTRLKYAGNSAKGTVVGTHHADGYLSMEIDKKGYLLHRLAWLYIHGELPIIQIDHIDGNRANNKLSNLREATTFENAQNRKTPSNNSSGYLGVYFKVTQNKWCAKIDVNNRRHYLGMFDSALEASVAYVEAKLRLHTFNPIQR